MPNPSSGSVGASNPLLAQEYSSARSGGGAPREMISAGLGTGHHVAPGPPGQGLECEQQRMGTRHMAGADSKFCESGATLIEVQ